MTLSHLHILVPSVCSLTVCMMLKVNSAGFSISKQSIKDRLREQWWSSELERWRQLHTALQEAVPILDLAWIQLKRTLHPLRCLPLCCVCDLQLMTQTAKERDSDVSWLLLCYRVLPSCWGLHTTAQRLMSRNVLNITVNRKIRNTGRGLSLYRFRHYQTLLVGYKWWWREIIFVWVHTLFFKKTNIVYF